MKISIFLYDTLKIQHYRAGKGITSSSNLSRLFQGKQHHTSAIPDRSLSSQLIDVHTNVPLPLLHQSFPNGYPKYPSCCSTPLLLHTPN